MARRLKLRDIERLENTSLTSAVGDGAAGTDSLYCTVQNVTGHVWTAVDTVIGTALCLTGTGTASN